jgi:hypothetical protein
MSEVNIGQQIKLVVESRGITITEFAKRINKSRENVYSIFSRKTIDTGLLSTISRVLDYDFFSHFSSKYQELNSRIQILEEENQLLKEYNSLLRKKEEEHK